MVGSRRSGRRPDLVIFAVLIFDTTPKDLWHGKLGCDGAAEFAGLACCRPPSPVGHRGSDMGLLAQTCGVHHGLVRQRLGGGLRLRRLH